MPLDLQVIEYGEVQLLRITGEVDLATAPALRSSIREIIDSHPAGLVIDLGDVPFLDSTGLGVLVAAYKQAIAAEVALCLVRPQRIVANAMALMRISTVIPVHDTVEAGVVAMGGPSPST